MNVDEMMISFTCVMEVLIRGLSECKTGKIV